MLSAEKNLIRAVEHLEAAAEALANVPMRVLSYEKRALRDASLKKMTEALELLTEERYELA